MMVLSAYECILVFKTTFYYNMVSNTNTGNPNFNCEVLRPKNRTLWQARSTGKLFRPKVTSDNLIQPKAFQLRPTYIIKHDSGG